MTKIDTVETEINFTTPFRTYMKSYYRQYTINFKQASFDTCAILAGAICEAILYQLLVDDNVSQELLGDAVGLGTLIKYIKLRKLDKELGFETQFFNEVNKLRNQSVHFGRFLKNQGADEVCISSKLSSFDEVIKQFGI
jgi:hypothetical protein